jgi:hypothetical protein
LTNQIESLKQYQTGLRELIAVLSDLAARRATIANVSTYVRTLSFRILTVAGAITGVAGLLKKVLIGRVMVALGGLGGLSSMGDDPLREDTFLRDKDYSKVERMIDEAEDEFLRAEQKIKQFRREYDELGCRVRYGSAP